MLTVVKLQQNNGTMVVAFQGKGRKEAIFGSRTSLPLTLPLRLLWDLGRNRQLLSCITVSNPRKYSAHDNGTDNQTFSSTTSCAISFEIRVALLEAHCAGENFILLPLRWKLISRMTRARRNSLFK